MKFVKVSLQIFLFLITAFYFDVSLAKGMEPIGANNLTKICTGYERDLSIYGANANIEYTPNIHSVLSPPALPVWAITGFPWGVFVPAVSYSHFAIVRSYHDPYPLISITDKSRHVEAIFGLERHPSGNWDTLRFTKAFHDRKFDFSFSGLVETGLHHTSKDVNCFAKDLAAQIYLVVALTYKAIAMGPHGKVIAVLNPADARGWIIVSNRDGETTSDISMAEFSDLNEVVRNHVTTSSGGKFADMGFAIAEKHVEVLNDPPLWLGLVGAVATGGSLADSEKLRGELLKADFDQGSITSLDRYIAEQRQGMFVHSAQFQY